ncbi:MAG TPA: MFS transporter [Solirubrobacteraceae bacterium]|nr:MFS transporter [Solirubrobacteraceae bacterium]HUA03809.1 MFS transporter [Solirubrobacteraceae bacterium]
MTDSAAPGAPAAGAPTFSANGASAATASPATAEPTAATATSALAEPAAATVTPATARTDEERYSNRWLILVIACLAQFMVVLDATVVNVALPSIQKGLHFSPTSLQWVVNAYTLVFGGFLLLGGRAGDLVGRKRLFLIGTALFAGASLLNGLAQSSGMLIFGRGLQGLGGALLSPAALSIITTTFTDQSERTKALGVWSAIAAGGGAVGLVLGGALTQLASWEWIFFVNVPVGVLTILATLRYVPESRADVKHRAFDVAGAITVTAGLVVLVYAIVKAQAYGWGSGRTIGLILLALVLLAGFVAIERRSVAPLVRLSIFRIRTLAVADGVLLLVASGMFGMFFFASLYVQEILGYSPLHAGLAFLPVTGGIVVGAGIAQPLVKRAGVRNVAVLGIVLATIGMVVLAQVPVHGTYAGDLLPGLLPLSIGMGLVFVPITLMATGGVDANDAGLASGLFNTAQQVGGSLGLAILSTLAASKTTNVLNGLHGSVSTAATSAAKVSGYHVAFIAAAVMLAAGALILATAVRRRDLESLSLELTPSAAAA